jgi:hypothetical protein
MNKMKHIKVLWFFLILVTFSRINATPQIAEIIILQGDTLLLRALPLESYLDDKKIDFQKILEEKGYGFSTACYRKYQGFWKLKNDSLFLIKIKACNPTKELNSDIDLSLIFDSSILANHPIFASWYSDTLTIPFGEEIYYQHSGWGSYYEKEVDFVMNNGRVVSRIEYDNSMSHIPKQYQTGKSLQEDIKSKINWKVVPKLDSIERVIVKVTKSEKDKTIAEVLKSSNPKLNLEALRIAREIDIIPVIYTRGKRLIFGWTFPVVFDERDRK